MTTKQLSPQLPKYQSAKQGFTLLELLISIGIFSLLTGLVLANFRTGERSDALRLAAEQVSQNIRRAQSMVLTGQVTRYKEEGEVEPREQFPQGGYGAAFTKQLPAQYTLFAAMRTGAPVDPPVLLDRLLSQVVIDNLLIGDAPTDTLLIAFRPPSAAVELRKSMQSFTEDARDATVVLRHLATNQKRRVIINRVSGRISVE